MKFFGGIGKDVGWGAAAWRGIVVFLAVSGFLYAFVLLVDPYNTLPFSLPLDRAPATTNQRFSYPAVAMNPDFDSVVVGTSVVRLLKPSELEDALGGRFANLSMNSAMPYEQSQILQLFLRHHPQPKTVIFGIDVVWCGQQPSPNLTERPFPPWLYDDNPWNDALYLFNLSAIEEAGRQFAQVAGLREEKYQRNGYRNFLPPKSEYDLAKVRGSIYGGGPIELASPVEPPAEGYADFRKSLAFPDLEILAELVARLPDSTRKIFLGAPIHAHAIDAPGSVSEAAWQECMFRIAKIGAAHKNTFVLDFRIRSEITTDDRNYWDHLHFGTDTASRIVKLVSDGVAAGRSTDPTYRFVLP